MELINICVIRNRYISPYALSSTLSYYGAYTYLNVAEGIGNQVGFSLITKNGKRIYADDFDNIRYGKEQS